LRYLVVLKSFNFVKVKHLPASGGKFLDGPSQCNAVNRSAQVRVRSPELAF
jgi:hypothetical protein